MTEVVIVFANRAKAQAFMSWLDTQGEQDYYGWIRIVNPKQEVETFEYDYNHQVINTIESE